MSLNDLKTSRPWIGHIDVERALVNSIIVTLVEGYTFAADPGCGVRGFDTVAAVRVGTSKKAVVAAASPPPTPDASIPSVLEKRFDPEGYQWEERGKVHQLNDLSRDDLLQVACQCMAVLERVDSLSFDLNSLTKLWREGEIYPEAAEPST